MSSKSPAALWIVVLLLVGAGGLLFYNLSGLTRDFSSPGPAPAVARTSRPGGPAPTGIDPSIAIAAARDAIAAGNAAAVADALKGLDVNGQFQLVDTGRRQMTLLTFAAIQPRPEMVQALLAAGARPDLASEGGVTPLMMAAARSDVATVAALLKAGAPVDATNKWGETALMNAARSGLGPNVKALLEGGASAKAADNEGNTALLFASGLGGNTEVVRILITAGCDVDAANKDGLTPLMRAADCGDDARCASLLDAGARVGLKDSDGRTALDWAKSRSDEAGAKCAAFLAKAGG